MNMIKLRNSRLTFLVSALLVFASALSAQEPETPEPPKPAGRGIPAMDDATAEDQNRVQDPLGGWNADTMPLTGMQTPTIGSQNLRHSYWVPGFQYSNSIQDQPSGTGSSGGWNTNNYFGANLSVVQQWNRSQLGLNLSAGGFVTNQPGQTNGWYQQLAFSELFSWRRWQIQILDQFSYLPESQFGFGGGTGLGAPGVGDRSAREFPGLAVRYRRIRVSTRRWGLAIATRWLPRSLIKPARAGRLPSPDPTGFCTFRNPATLIRTPIMAASVITTS